jgi:hypothetical protein
VSAPYRPGQQWPPQRPERPPPIQFRQEEAPAPPPPNKALQWGLRVAGLVAIAVVSGLVWYYVTSESASTPTTGTGSTGTPKPEGVYTFTAHSGTPSPDTDTDCAKHAYGDIQDFLKSKPCDHLARQLFVTKVDGRVVYASISVVTMPDEAEAKELRDLTDTEDTGNVSDVVKDGLVKIDGLKQLTGDAGYASNQSGRDVIIIEAAFAPGDTSGDEDADEKVVDSVCEDALRLASQVDRGSGSG